MRQYIIYLIVPVCLAVLCAVSKGGLHTASGWIAGHIRGIGKAADPETLYRAMLILLVMDLAAFLSDFSGRNADTAAKGYLTRGGYGSGTETETLELNLDGETHEVEVDVEARKLEKKEIQALLEEAAAEAEKTALNGQDPRHICRPLHLKESFVSGKVRAEWITDRPEVIGWEGEIGDVPEAGEETTVCAMLSCEQETKEVSFAVRVYPELLGSEEQLSKDVAEIIEKNNSVTEERVELPDEVMGKKALWSAAGRDDGVLLLFLGAVIAVFYVYAAIRKREETAEKYREELLLDYPHIVSKVVLLNSAGLSMRKSFEKMRRDYGESRSRGSPARSGYEEIVKTCAEMENGVPEKEAYVNLGKRTGTEEYRAFAALLVENLTKGGAGIAKLLRKEADRAFDERKKRAKEQGEKAGTRLLLPMMLLLAVLMAVLMVPAMAAFL